MAGYRVQPAVTRTICRKTSVGRSRSFVLGSTRSGFSRHRSDLSHSLKYAPDSHAEGPRPLGCAKLPHHRADRNHSYSGFEPLEVVGPFLHHLPALWKVFRMYVRGGHVIAFDVRHLPLGHIPLGRVASGPRWAPCERSRRKSRDRPARPTQPPIAVCHVW
jgi:hypothetical protein